MTRFLATYIASPYSKEKLKTYSDLIKFPWDTNIIESANTEEAKRLRKEMFDKWDAEKLLNGK